jgi:tetratricopeptide (TPR) repeat protein
MLTAIIVALSYIQQPVPGVGEVSFPNSGAPAAQEAFLSGLAQLHNFEYADAAEWFRKAQDADPSFALAYWGEAMTYNHPVWMEQDIAAARRALKRLGDTAEARAARAKTDREKAYLRTVEILYGEGDKYARDAAYAEAMADLHRASPDDIEATAFYALALLGTAHEGRDFATYMRSAALLEPLFPKYPNHPGIAHYLIHSYDDPVHAPLGLRAARAYSKIAPSAGHAQHMCSHIFVAMGMWDDVVEANETAVKLTARPGRPPAACGHYPSWLAYGYLEQGRNADARRMVLACRDSVQRPAAYSAVAEMRARYLIDTGEWNGDVATIVIPPVHPPATLTYEFTNALGAIRRDDLAGARGAIERFESARKTIEAELARSGDPSRGDLPTASARGRMNVLGAELAGMMHVKNGEPVEGIKLLRSAAAEEDRLPYEFGPPFIDKPSYELLGEALLIAHQPVDARAAFEKALARTPGRTTALVGLMKAAEQTGDAKKAAAVRAELRAIWHRADRTPTILQ